MPTPTTTYATASPSSVQLPGLAAQARVEYSRNPNSFAIARYLRMVPVDDVIGQYPEFNAADVARVVSQRDYGWPDGQPMPKFDSRRFRWKPYLCERRAYGFTIGQLSAQQGSGIDIEGANMRGEVHRAMTDRTLDAVDVLTTTGNWPAANTSADVDTLLGGTGKNWGAASTSALSYIKESVQSILEIIQKETAGVVRPDNVMLVISPSTAHTMSRSGEIQAYMTGHETAWPILNQRQRNIITMYSLPPFLYGLEVVVEDCVKVTDRRDTDGTATTAYALGNQALFLSRVDNPAVDEAPTVVSASTVTGFFQEELNVEARVEEWDRLTEGRVVENRDIRLSSPSSGYLLADITD